MATQNKTKRATSTHKRSTSQQAKAGRQSHKNDNKKSTSGSHSGSYSSGSSMRSSSWDEK